MSKRFERSRADSIVAYLHASGIDPLAKTVPPSTNLFGGCSDPECCPQHSGRTAAGLPMMSIETKLSGCALSKLARRLTDRAS
jgi:hypothetical protein